MSKSYLKVNLKSRLLLLLDKKKKSLNEKYKTNIKLVDTKSTWDNKELENSLNLQKNPILFYNTFYYNKFVFHIFKKYWFFFNLIVSFYYLTNIEFCFLKTYCLLIKQIQYFSLQLLYKLVFTVIAIYPIHIHIVKLKGSLFFLPRHFNYLKKKNQLIFLIILFMLYLYKTLRIQNIYGDLHNTRFIRTRNFFMDLIWFRGYLTGWFLTYYPTVF